MTDKGARVQGTNGLWRLFEQRGSHGPLLIAHRAGNDLQMARRLADSGVDLVEADVWLYRGQLEVRHAKTLGPLPLLWDRWSLQGPSTTRLRLDTLLAGMSGNSMIMYDIKGRHPGLPERLVHLARRYRSDQPIIVCSQHWQQLDAFKDVNEAILVHSIGNRRQLRAVWPRLTTLDHDAVSIHASLLSVDTVASLKEHVSFVMSWPINDIVLAEKMTAMRVDGLITDRPDELMRWRGVSTQPIPVESGP